MSSPSRIVIVADNPASTASFRASLASQPDISFAAAVTCASCSFSAVSQQRPSLVVIDLKMPEHRLLELARDLTVLHPGLKILLVSRHGQELDSERVLRSGAHGCVATGSSIASLLAAVRQVLNGRPSFPPPEPHPQRRPSYSRSQPGGAGAELEPRPPAPARGGRRTGVRGHKKCCTVTWRSVESGAA